MDQLERIMLGVASLISKLAKRILPCQECDRLASVAAASVRPFAKPCAQFDIYTKWKPSAVKVPCIAEAPPGTSEGYFYDHLPRPGSREILRRNLFDLLEFKGADTAAKLATFNSRGYFLADAVKCRCKKTGGQPPTSVTKTCAKKWLQEELEELGSPRRICVLGRSALLGLSQVEGFENLAAYLAQ